MKRRRENHLSAKVLLFDYVYGQHWVSTIPKHYIQDPIVLTTRRNAGYEKNFPDKFLESGLRVVLKAMQIAKIICISALETGEPKCVYVAFDKNDDVFLASTSKWNSMYEYLESDEEFVEIDDCYSGESILYGHEYMPIFVEVNKPWCKSADSRLPGIESNITTSDRIVRGMSVHVSSITVKIIRGVLQPISENILYEYEFPGVMGGYEFEMADQNLHLGVKVAAAFHKSNFAPAGVNPLVQNNLQKTPSPDYPISRSARDRVRGVVKDTTTDRKQETDIIDQALCYVSHHQDDDDLELADWIWSHFRKDDADVGKQSDRWHRLFDRIRYGSDLHSKVVSCQDHTVSNNGGHGRYTSPDEKAANIKIIQEIVDSVEKVPITLKLTASRIPSKYHFWINEETLTEKTRGYYPPGTTPTEGKEYQYEFGGKPLWNISFGTIQEKWKKERQKKLRKQHYSLSSVLHTNRNLGKIRNGPYIKMYLQEVNV